MTMMISVRPVPMSGKDKEHHTQVPGRNVPSTVGRGLFIKLMRWHGFLISGVEATCEKPQSNFHLIYIRIIISSSSSTSGSSSTVVVFVIVNHLLYYLLMYLYEEGWWERCDLKGAATSLKNTLLRCVE